MYLTFKAYIKHIKHPFIILYELIVFLSCWEFLTFPTYTGEHLNTAPNLSYQYFPVSVKYDQKKQLHEHNPNKINIADCLNHS